MTMIKEAHFGVTKGILRTFLDPIIFASVAVIVEDNAIIDTVLPGSYGSHY